MINNQSIFSKNLFNTTVLVSALGYFVDIYDLILFGIVRIPSLVDLGIKGDGLITTGVLLLNMQMGGMLIGGIIWGILRRHTRRGRQQGDGDERRTAADQPCHGRRGGRRDPRDRDGADRLAAGTARLPDRLHADLGPDAAGRPALPRHGEERRRLRLRPSHGGAGSGNDDGEVRDCQLAHRRRQVPLIPLPGPSPRKRGEGGKRRAHPSSPRLRGEDAGRQMRGSLPQKPSIPAFRRRRKSCCRRDRARRPRRSWHGTDVGPVPPRPCRPRQERPHGRHRPPRGPGRQGRW